MLAKDRGRLKISSKELVGRELFARFVGVMDSRKPVISPCSLEETPDNKKICKYLFMSDIMPPLSVETLRPVRADLPDRGGFPECKG
jgi:hypothetical protein